MRKEQPRGRGGRTVVIDFETARDDGVNDNVAYESAHYQKRKNSRGRLCPRPIVTASRQSRVRAQHVARASQTIASRAVGKHLVWGGGGGRCERRRGIGEGALIHTRVAQRSRPRHPAGLVRLDARSHRSVNNQTPVQENDILFNPNLEGTILGTAQRNTLGEKNLRTQMSDFFPLIFKKS